MIHKVRCPICLLTTLKKYLVLVLNEIAASLCQHFLKKVLFSAIQKMASEMLFLACLLYASAEKLRPYKSNKRNGTFSCEEGKYLYCIERQIEVIDQKVGKMLENQEKIDRKRKK